MPRKEPVPSQIAQCMFPGCCGASIIGQFFGTDSRQIYPTKGPHATFATLVEGAQDEYIEALLKQGWWKVMRWPGEHQSEVGKPYTVCLMVKGERVEAVELPKDMKAQRAL